MSDESAKYHNDLGHALLKKGEIAQAVAALGKAVDLEPGYVEAWIHLGNAHAAARDYGSAVAAYRRALELAPDYAEVHSNLGHALWKAGQLNDAIAACGRAIQLRPNYFAAWSNIGNVLLDAGRDGEAIAAHRQALNLAPNDSKAHFNLGIALLQNGEFQEGWQHYEWRWGMIKSTVPEPRFSQTMWDGDELRGRRIFLHPEGGYGDTIQFARYAPLVAARGGKVVLGCSPELSRLLQGMDGVAELAVTGREIPPFDVHCPLLSLPRVMETTVGNVPAEIPYLRCETSRADFWRRRMGENDGRLKVGLLWAGSAAHLNNRTRSIPAATFAPLAQIPRARFFSLQKGEPASQIRDLPREFQFTDWTSEFGDFTETAAMIANMDLVIAPDTAVVHLAGALGKRTWVLLPTAPDWRWMRRRSDSPWYPTMRLFRQSRAGDWSGPISEVAAAMQMLAAANS